MKEMPHDECGIPSPFNESSIDVSLLCALKTGKSLKEVMNALKLEFETRDFEGLSTTVKETAQAARKISEDYIPLRRTRKLFKKYALNRRNIDNRVDDKSFHLRFWIAMRSEALDEFKDSLDKIEGMLNEKWLDGWKWQKGRGKDVSGFWNYAARFRRMKREDWNRITYLGNATGHFAWILESLLAALAVLILLPFFIMIATLIFFTMGRPVMLTQKRVGRLGKKFPLLKFRSMYNREQYKERSGANSWATETSAHDGRITSLGRILRKYKLDELPQLINIARGDMGFVGYRPEMPERVAGAETYYAVLCQQRPGITDPASLAFIDEGKIISELSNIHGDKAYDEIILPVKTSKSIAYLLRRVKYGGDIKVIFRTVYESFFPHFRNENSELPGKEPAPQIELGPHEQLGCDVRVDLPDNKHFVCNVNYGDTPGGESMPVVIFEPGEEKCVSFRFFCKQGRQSVSKALNKGETLIRAGLIYQQRIEFHIVDNTGSFEVKKIVALA